MSLRLGGRAIALGAAVVIALTSLAGPSSARAQPLPPDDGAPPEDSVPSADGTVHELPPSESEVIASATASDPPSDNVFPISGRSASSCSNNFGAPRWPDRTHKGVDCFAPIGTPLIAAEAGSIRYATRGEPFSCSTGGDISGNRVSVRGVSGYLYYYGHLDQILVETNQLVAKGQVIGTLGRTGNAACSSAHLHFEVKCGEDEEPFDPYPDLLQWRSATSRTPGWPTAIQGNGAGVVFSGTRRADLFVRDCNGAILQRPWFADRGGQYPSWIEMPASTDFDPDAASAGESATPQAYFRGNDTAVWQLFFTGSRWATRNLGGSCNSGPTAVYSGSARADVFCRGADMAIYVSTWFAGRGWQPWYRIGGYATSDPDAASAGPGATPQVYYRSAENTIHQIHWNGSSWQVVNLGGGCSSGPSAAYSGPGRVDVYCRGLNMTTYHKSWQQGVGWSGWTNIDTIVISSPEASNQGPGAPPQFFARGLDRRMYQFVWTGSAWRQISWGVN